MAGVYSGFGWPARPQSAWPRIGNAIATAELVIHFGRSFLSTSFLPQKDCLDAQSR